MNPVRHILSPSALALVVLFALLPRAATAKPATPTSPEQHTEQIGEVKLHYVSQGKGELVILLHGWPETWIAWRPVMADLAKNYQVVAVDYRGAGGSERPSSGYDKVTMAGDIRGLIQSLGRGKAHVVGHDIGGMIAFELAARSPEVVRDVTIVDVPIPGTTIWPQIPKYAWWFAFHGKELVPESLVEGNERLYLDWFFDHQAANPSAITEATRAEYARAYGEAGGMHSAFELYRAFPQDLKDATADLKTPITVPLLAVGGEKSAGAFIAAMAKELSPTASAFVVPGAGHFVAEEQPAALSARLRQFFASGK